MLPSEICVGLMGAVGLSCGLGHWVARLKLTGQGPEMLPQTVCQPDDDMSIWLALQPGQESVRRAMMQLAGPQM